MIVSRDLAVTSRPFIAELNLSPAPIKCSAPGQYFIPVAAAASDRVHVRYVVEAAWR